MRFHGEIRLLLLQVLLNLAILLDNLRLGVAGSLREARGGTQKQTDPGERDGSLHAHDAS
jgi:hypothetical protein